MREKQIYSNTQTYISRNVLVNMDMATCFVLSLISKFSFRYLTKLCRAVCGKCTVEQFEFTGVLNQHFVLFLVKLVV